MWRNRYFEYNIYVHRGIVRHDVSKHWQFIVNEGTKLTLKLYIHQIYGMFQFIYTVGDLIHWMPYFGISQIIKSPAFQP